MNTTLVTPRFMMTPALWVVLILLCASLFSSIGFASTLSITPQMTPKFTRFILNPAIKVVNKILAFSSIKSTVPKNMDPFFNANLRSRAGSAIPLPILLNSKDKPMLMLKLGAQHRAHSSLTLNTLSYETLTKGFGNPNQENQRISQNGLHIGFGLSICF